MHKGMMADAQDASLVFSGDAEPAEQIRQLTERLANVMQKNEALTRSLHESESQFRRLIDQHSAIMLLIDPYSRTVVEANPAASLFYGYAQEQMRGMSVEKINAKPESEMHQQRMQVLQGDRGQLEVEHLLSDGEVRTVKVLTSAISISGETRLFSIIYDMTEQKLLEQELKNQAHIDFLTGLSNRRHFMHQAELELARAVRYGKNLSLLMMDIDYFKRINDDFGHQVGDLVLKKLASICRSVLREVDVVGRVGGEEFAVLLPETGLDEGVEIAERIRAAIEAGKVPMDGALPIHFHVSVGITSLASPEDNLDVLLAQADKALYEAKNTGRNRIQVATGQER